MNSVPHRRLVMTHPVAVGALGLLILNDQFLKPAYGNVITGKLSDIAGLVVAPLLSLAAVDLANAFRRRPDRPLNQVFPWILAVVGSGFVMIQLATAASNAYASALSALGIPSRNYADRTDLLALPALAVAWWVAARSDRPIQQAQAQQQPSIGVLLEQRLDVDG